MTGSNRTPIYEASDVQSNPTYARVWLRIW